MSSVQFILGDLQGAKASLDRSLALDKQFAQTYPLLGDCWPKWETRPGGSCSLQTGSPNDT